jgi:hypothetical protein
MVTEELLDPGTVVTVKVAVVAPPPTVIVAGTCAADVLPLASATSAPPAGAAPFRVTVPVEVFPAVTELGVSDTAEIAGGVTVNVAERVVP